MKTEQHSILSGKFTIGVITALGLIGYFLLMKLVGLTHVTELRLFNFVILFSGVFWSMKRESRFSKGNSDLSPLGAGCITVLTAVTLFTSFLYLYLVADTALMNDICKHSSVGSFLTPETAAIGVLAEGMSSGIVMAYILLSFSKNKNLKDV